MSRNKFSMAMLSASALFALMSASTHAQNMSNTSNATGTSATTTKQAASNPNAATQTKQSMTTANQTSGQSNSGATASGMGTSSLSKADQKMVRDLAMANMAEVETARMAQSKTQSEEVKQFAQRMIDDHSRALTEVQQLAQNKGVTLPTELDKMHKAKADKLAKLSGEQFDRTYMKQAGVMDHKKTHAKLNKGMKSAKDPDLKALVAKLEPTVTEHLHMAQQQTGSKMGSTGSSGTAGTTASGNAGMNGSHDKAMHDKPMHDKASQKSTEKR